MGLHSLSGAAPLCDDDCLVIAEIGHAPAWSSGPDNTLIVRWAEVDLSSLHARSMRSAVRVAPDVGVEALLDGLVASHEVRDLASRISSSARQAAKPLVPAWVVVFHDGPAVHVYTQIRFTPADGCFIRLTSEPIPVQNPSDLSWLPEAVALRSQDATFLGNHQKYYHKAFEGQELEYKYTLRPPNADIWTLTADLYQHISDGGLARYVLEYGDEFQAWDYNNHLFQIADPPGDRGYISFIPTTDGKHLLKRKWFQADAFLRRESHVHGVEPVDGYLAYIDRELGLSAIALPPFRRLRYDVNLESLRSGHVYGIYFDTVTLLDEPTQRLQQCELEYLRTRSVAPPDEQLVLAELDGVAAWLEAFLRTRGLSDRRTYYSKMSFLLDCVRSEPGLQPRGES